ncbi:PREDICTED: phosphatidylglycerophosphatase and protein-tyrosine phosphatase 1 isoform X2 [Ceratotherium simum simum]|uniref:Phosphatidylglycerophosphatase and protein-tyrosine phosphatase 1 isoform X2 n=1 Tax=Ceratotherium simum simum TaxID=73337 RepID=A0ABM1D8E5_CERSS|nr:PREDICTED: phosphatidylglycerophosphatase and protein-tyrosine phosphatase 1 isoform X2 [Ceratotherium simum simum]
MVPAPGAPGCPAESRAAGPQVPAPTREAADDSPPLWVSSRPGTASPGAGGSALRYVERGRMAAFLEAGLARVLFYPTLLYTVFRGKAPGRAHRDWYHRIDPTVLLGALPLRSMTRRLVQDENVRGVITMNEEYETRFLCNSAKVHNWSPEEAVGAIAKIRSHIYIRPGQFEVLKEFHKEITAGAAKDETCHTSET